MTISLPPPQGQGPIPSQSNANIKKADNLPPAPTPASSKKASPIGKPPSALIDELANRLKAMSEKNAVPKQNAVTKQVEQHMGIQQGSASVKGNVLSAVKGKISSLISPKPTVIAKINDVTGKILKNNTNLSPSTSNKKPSPSLLPADRNKSTTIPNLVAKALLPVPSANISKSFSSPQTKKETVQAPPPPPPPPPLPPSMEELPPPPPPQQTEEMIAKNEELHAKKANEKSEKSKLPEQAPQISKKEDKPIAQSKPPDVPKPKLGSVSAKDVKESVSKDLAEPANLKSSEETIAKELGLIKAGLFETSSIVLEFGKKKLKYTKKSVVKAIFLHNIAMATPPGPKQPQSLEFKERQETLIEILQLKKAVIEKVAKYLVIEQGKIKGKIPEDATSEQCDAYFNEIIYVKSLESISSGTSEIIKEGQLAKTKKESNVYYKKYFNEVKKMIVEREIKEGRMPPKVEAETQKEYLERQGKYLEKGLKEGEILPKGEKETQEKYLERQGKYLEKGLKEGKIPPKRIGEAQEKYLEREEKYLETYFKGIIEKGKKSGKIFPQVEAETQEKYLERQGKYLEREIEGSRMSPKGGKETQEKYLERQGKYLEKGLKKGEILPKVEAETEKQYLERQDYYLENYFHEVRDTKFLYDDVHNELLLNDYDEKSFSPAGLIFSELMEKELLKHDNIKPGSWQYSELVHHLEVRHLNIKALKDDLKDIKAKIKETEENNKKEIKAEIEREDKRVKSEKLGNNAERTKRRNTDLESTRAKGLYQLDNLNYKKEKIEAKIKMHEDQIKKLSDLPDKQIVDACLDIIGQIR